MNSSMCTWRVEGVLWTVPQECIFVVLVIYITAQSERNMPDEIEDVRKEEREKKCQKPRKRDQSYFLVEGQSRNGASK